MTLQKEITENLIIKDLTPNTTNTPNTNTQIPQIHYQTHILDLKDKADHKRFKL